jgi:hypothetical protein
MGPPLTRFCEVNGQRGGEGRNGWCIVEGDVSGRERARCTCAAAYSDRRQRKARRGRNGALGIKQHRVWPESVLATESLAWSVGQRHMRAVDPEPSWCTPALLGCASTERRHRTDTTTQTSGLDSSGGNGLTCFALPGRVLWLGLLLGRCAIAASCAVNGMATSATRSGVGWGGVGRWASLCVDRHLSKKPTTERGKFRAFRLGQQTNR